jgi:SAM-dependent methyltransferase
MGKVEGDAWASLLQPNEVEHRRLQVIGEVWDGGTFQHLTDLGIAEGWHCLEAGAGEGSVTRWLSERVGDGGHVVATDVDTRFLDFRGVANVDVVQHDLRTDPCPGEPFDLIHVRAVLMHLPERDRIVERLATWLKPGGWVVLEDLFVLPEMFSPGLFSRFWAGAMGVAAARVGTDCAWALTQPEPMRSIGLVETGASVQVPPTFPPAGAQRDSALPPVLEFALRSLEQLAPAMAQLELFTEEDASEMAELLKAGDSSLLSYGLGMVSAWGQRPTVPA